MRDKQIETDHNLWFRVVAKTQVDEQFKEELLHDPDKLLNAEFRDLRREIISEIINDPKKMEQVFGDGEEPVDMDMEEMEERLAAFGYIGF